MKQKALRAGDAHSHEDEECRKRLRSARECAEAHSLIQIPDNYKKLALLVFSYYQLFTYL